jgi:flagellar FliL protein
VRANYEDRIVADEDMTENETGSVPVSKGNGMVKIIAIVLSVIILIAVSIGTTLYFSGVMSTDKQNHDIEADTIESATPAKGKGSEIKVPIYYAFDPAFVVNFNDGKNIRYLQLTMEIMTYKETVVNDIEKHMPVLRNNLIMMLSNLNYEVINTVAGKRKLQNEALTEIKSILLEKTGREGVEEVYFTGFVMQ